VFPNATLQPVRYWVLGRYERRQGDNFHNRTRAPRTPDALFGQGEGRSDAWLHLSLSFSGLPAFFKSLLLLLISS